MSAAVPAPGAARAGVDLRVLPGALLGRGSRLLERNLRVQRRTWLVVVSGFFEPLLYLLSIGVGLGHLVGRLPGPGGGTVAYAAFVAPGLLASAAMNGAVTESTFNVYFKLRYAKTYDAVLATPLGPRDVAAGELATALLRGTLYSGVFLLAMASLGDVASPWAILAFPSAVLIGFAFAGVGMAVTTYLRSWRDFDLVQLTILPLFLFSTTFYPLTTYPGWFQAVVRVSPLYQGVALCRDFCLGELSWALVAHAAYLVAIGAAGLAVTGRRIRQILLR